jgi:hypothetical protein
MFSATSRSDDGRSSSYTVSASDPRGWDSRILLYGLELLAKKGSCAHLVPDPSPCNTTFHWRILTTRKVVQERDELLLGGVELDRVLAEYHRLSPYV